jgi:uncharacterized cupin superfamily protein
MPAVVNYANVVQETIEEVDIAFRRRRLGQAAGTSRIGLSHYTVRAGARAMPVHVHGDEEEIFYVLRGQGIGYEVGVDAYPITTGDTLVHRPERRPHTRFADPDTELELLAFGSGSDTGSSYLPRAGVMWSGPRWVPLDAPHPLRAEALAGPLERPETLGERPAHVARADAVAVTEPSPGARVRALGAAAGSVAAGLNHVVLAPGARGTPPHCHTLEEEVYVVLDGAGTLTLDGAEHPLVPGDVVARPPATGVCHHLSAGPQGMTYLVYGTRQGGDAVRYPEAGTIALRGLGITLAVGG